MLTILKQKTVEWLLEYLTFNYTWTLRNNGTIEINDKNWGYYEIKGLQLWVDLVYQDKEVLEEFSKIIK